MHRIKKYANRKLYNVTTKGYVTMDDIAELVQSGEEITIIDNATGKDITQEIVSQLVGRVFDGHARKLPLDVLVRLMQRGSGGLVDYTRKYVSFWQNALNLAEDELDRVDTMIGRERAGDGKDSEQHAAESDADAGEFGDWLNERIDQRLEEVLKSRDLAAKRKINNMKKEMTRLSARLETFENIFSQMLKSADVGVPKAARKTRKSSS